MKIYAVWLHAAPPIIKGFPSNRAALFHSRSLATVRAASTNACLVGDMLLERHTSHQATSGCTGTVATRA